MSQSTEIHVGDIGTVIEITVYDSSSIVNISSATTKTITLQKPSGTILTKTAAFTTTGTDGKIRYTTLSGDIDESGLWFIQAHIVMPTGSWSTERDSFNVLENIQ